MKKKLAGAAAVCMMTISAMAQNTSPNKGGFLIRGGVNLSNISVTSNGRVDDANILPSFHIGVGADLPLADGLSLQPSLLFTGKGAKVQSGSSSDATYYKATSNPYYLELPVNLTGKIPLSEYTRLYIGAGPYVAMGIAGKNKVEGKIFGTAFESKSNIKFSNDDPTTSTEEDAGYGKLKRFDYGLNAVAGLEFNKFTIGAGYGYGLAKINSNTDNGADDKGKNRVWNLSLGIKL